MTMAQMTELTTTASEAATAAATKTTPKRHMNLFDLANVGLSSTLAVAVFIGIGYVVRHVAGPSAIVSVLVAAFIAYLVGKFKIPNCKLTHTHTHTSQHKFSQIGKIYNIVYR